jgi:hypothetical protein
VRVYSANLREGTLTPARSGAAANSPRFSRSTGRGGARFKNPAVSNRKRQLVESLVESTPGARAQVLMQRITPANLGPRCLALASWFSAAICIAAGVLWVCTWRVGRGVAFHNYPDGQMAALPPQTWGEISSRRGSLGYVHAATDYPPDYPRVPMRWFLFRFTGDWRSGSTFERLDPGPTDFYFHNANNWSMYPHAQRTTVLLVPHWAAMAGASVLPAWRLFAAVRRRRASGQGRCMVCGYDLRASPGRCPECGTDRSSGAPAAA